MKNSLKLSLLALAIAASFTACDATGKKPATDSPATNIDTGKNGIDTANAIDTAKAAGDTTKKDSVKK